MLRRLQALNIAENPMLGEVLKQVQDDFAMGCLCFGTGMPVPSTPYSQLPYFLNAPDHSAILLRLDYGGPCRKVIASLLLLSTSPLLPLSASPPQVFWHKKQTSAKRMLMRD
jgi:hypothetical protein